MTHTDTVAVLRAAREPCLNGRCYSPVACSGFGYCRERNMADKRTTPETIARHRAIAAEVAKTEGA